MKITEKDVQYIADLSRLSLSEEEIHTYAGQLEQILEFIDKLNELNVDNVEPMSSVLNIKNVKRADSIQRKYKTEEILDNAPKKENNFFIVPQVIKG